MSVALQNLVSGCLIIWMGNTPWYGPPCCSRCMPLLVVACTYQLYVHFYHSLCRTMSSYSLSSYVLLCHTSNRVADPSVLKLHSLLSSDFFVVVPVPKYLFCLFCSDTLVYFLNLLLVVELHLLFQILRQLLLHFFKFLHNLFLTCFLSEFFSSVFFSHYMFHLSFVFQFFLPL